MGQGRDVGTEIIWKWESTTNNRERKVPVTRTIALAMDPESDFTKIEYWQYFYLLADAE